MGYFGTLEHTKVLGVGAGAAGTHRRPRPARGRAGALTHSRRPRARTHPVQHTAQRANDNEVVTRLPALLSPLP
jgi:hypothetical protein